MRRRPSHVSRVMGAGLLAAVLAGCALGRPAPAVQTGMLEVEGGRLAYEVSGSGPAVVLVHGGLVDSRMWDAEFADLARHHRVVRYDLRGLGRSPRPTGSFSHVDDLDRLLRELRVDTATLVGLSLGGMVASEYTLEHPGRVRALVLAAAGLRGFQGRPRPGSDAFYRIAAADPARAAAIIQDSTTLGGATARSAAILRRMFVDNAPGWSSTDWRSLRWPEPPTIQRLDRIAVPTLVVVGTADDPDLLAIADTLAARIPHAAKTVIPGARHHLNLDRPAQFRRELRGFLARTEPR
jgi:3-oxoadipate enol-lactonase